MTPSHRHDHRETIAFPQALIRDLRVQEGALPEALRRQCVAAGAAMVPVLIALLESGLADNQAEPEGALYHAVDLLGTLGDARAVPILLRCLAHDDLFDALGLPAAAALPTLGPAAFEGCLAAYAMTTDDAFRDRLAGVLTGAGSTTSTSMHASSRPCSGRPSWEPIISRSMGRRGRWTCSRTPSTPCRSGTRGAP